VRESRTDSCWEQDPGASPEICLAEIPSIASEGILGKWFGLSCEEEHRNRTPFPLWDGTGQQSFWLERPPLIVFPSLLEEGRKFWWTGSGFFKEPLAKPFLSSRLKSSGS